MSLHPYNITILYAYTLYEVSCPLSVPFQVAASPEDFRRAFAFLEDAGVDALPPEDLKRGLKPVADLITKLS